MPAAGKRSRADSTASGVSVASVASAASVDTTDLRRSAANHDAFFARIIDMVPKDLYKPPEENPVDVNSKFYKHRKQPLAPDVKKALSKQKRAEKYAPGGEDDQDGGAGGEAADDDDDGDDDDDDDDDDDETQEEEDRRIEGAKDDDARKGETGASLEDAPSLAVTKQEQLELLRQRLHARIVGLQSQRQGKKRPRSGSDADLNGAPVEGAKREKDNKDGKKARGGAFDASTKMSNGARSMPHPPSSSSSSTSSLHVAASNPLPPPPPSAQAAPLDARSVDVHFSTILGSGSAVGGGGASGGSSSSVGKPGTKMQRLRRMLESAENQRKRLEELKRSGEEGSKRAREEQWSEVLGAASGKQSVDVQKVKKAMKRIEHDKQKSASEWAGRLSKVKEAEATKQARREQNIKIHKLGQAPPEKEGGTEKRGRFNPGFEGKKINGGSFLNDKTKPHAGAGKGQGQGQGQGSGGRGGNKNRKEH